MPCPRAPQGVPLQERVATEPQPNVLCGSECDVGALHAGDAGRFYLLLNRIAQNGIDIESVAPADDDVLSVYEYLIGTEEPAQ